MDIWTGRKNEEEKDWCDRYINSWWKIGGVLLLSAGFTAGAISACDRKAKEVAIGATTAVVLPTTAAVVPSPAAVLCPTANVPVTAKRKVTLADVRRDWGITGDIRWYTAQ